MKLKYLVIDDEPLARKLIISHVAKIETFNFAGECTDAIEAIGFLQKQQVDLLFLDIEMPEMDGFQLIRTLKHPPAVILTTAFRNYAPEAFDMDVVDYLLKPISFERLVKATNKFLYQRSVPLSKKAEDPEPDFIYIKADRKMHKVPVEEIIYVESLDEYIKIHLPRRVLISRENITTIDEKLGTKSFVRVHRSFIVSMRYLNAISSDGVEVGGVLIPFGRAYKHAAMSALGMGVK